MLIPARQLQILNLKNGSSDNSGDAILNYAFLGLWGQVCVCGECGRVGIPSVRGKGGCPTPVPTPLHIPRPCLKNRSVLTYRIPPVRPRPRFFPEAGVITLMIHPYVSLRLARETPRTFNCIRPSAAHVKCDEAGRMDYGLDGRSGRNGICESLSCARPTSLDAITWAFRPMCVSRLSPDSCVFR